MPHGPPPTAGDQFQLLPAAGVAAVMAWWRVLQARVVNLGHRPGATAGRQPSRTPRQSRPAGIVVACCVSGGAALHRPLGLPQPVQLRCQRPGAVLQVLQVAVAVEGPAVDAAGPAAPIAGLRGARTGVVGLWPTGASMALVDPRSGREADLPGPTGRPAGHQVSPPLAWLPGSDQPAKQAGTAQPEPHCISTVRPGGGACRARSGCGRRPEGVTAGASSTTISPASPTTSTPPAAAGPGPTPGRGRGRRRSARSWPSADRRTGRGRLASGLPLVSDSHPPAPLHAAPMSRQDGRTTQGTAPTTAGKFTDTGYAGERLS